MSWSTDHTSHVDLSTDSISLIRQHRSLPGLISSLPLRRPACPSSGRPQALVPAADHIPAVTGPGQTGWRCRPVGGASVFVPPTVHAHACRPTRCQHGSSANHLYYWPGMRKDIDVWCKQCEECATSKRPPNRPRGHLRKVFTGAPIDLVAIDICLACLHRKMATSISSSPLTTSPNGWRQNPCVTQRHPCACAHFTMPTSTVLACLVSCTAIREATSRIDWWRSFVSLRALTKPVPRRFTLGLTVRPNGRIRRSFKCSVHQLMSVPSLGQNACRRCLRRTA